MDIEKIKKDFGFYSKVVLMFSLILGIAYLYGYWSELDVNIFPFLSLFDLIRFSAYPLLILYVPILLIYWLITELHFQIYLQKQFKSLEGYLKKHHSRCLKYSSLFFIIGYFVTVVWLGVFLHLSTLKFGVPVASLIAILWLRNVLKKEKLDDEIKELHQFGRGLLFLCLLPFASYDFGHRRAEMIVKEKEYSYMVFEQDGKSTPYKFLGFLNGHYFFIGKDNKTLLIDNKLDRLNLKHYLKKGEQDSPDIGYT